MNKEKQQKLQIIVDSIDGMACIYSVETTEDGKCGDIRLVAANEPYLASLKETTLKTQGIEFEFQPGMLYTTYNHKNLNFENSCYECAVKKKCPHSYVQMKRFFGTVWLHSSFFPIHSDEENIHYCGIIVDFNDQPDAEKMSSISGDLAATVLEMSLKIEQTTDFKTAMDSVIKDLRELCGAKRCCIYLIDNEERICDVLCESIAADAPLQIPMTEIIDPAFYDLILTWDYILGDNTSLFLQNEDDMKLVEERNPGWYKNLVDNHVKSMIIFPLRFGGELLGYIWATNISPEKSRKVKETMEVASFILGSEIANYLLVNRLKVLSAKDLLTGVMNRNEMNGIVEKYATGKIGAGKSVGVVFADLNGLKYVNDLEGHPEGDELLRQAANALLEVFNMDTIYRAGGDEFTMILSDITEEELEAKATELKTVMGLYDRVSFAVGTHWAPDGSDIRIALREADQKMYADKEEYYHNNPGIMRGRFIN